MRLIKWLDDFLSREIYNLADVLFFFWLAMGTICIFIVVFLLVIWSVQ